MASGIQVTQLQVPQSSGLGQYQPFKQPDPTFMSDAFQKGQAHASKMRMNDADISLKDIQGQSLQQDMGLKQQEAGFKEQDQKFKQLGMIRELTGSVVTAPKEQQATMWAQNLAQAKAMGIDVSSVPTQWDDKAMAFAANAFMQSDKAIKNAGQAAKLGLMPNTQGQAAPTIGIATQSKSQLASDEKAISTAKADAAEQASLADATQRMRKAGADAYTGPGGSMVATGAQTLDAIGLGNFGGASKKAAAAGTIQQVSGMLKGAMRKQVIGSGQVSNAEQQMLLDTIPTINDSPASFNAKLDAYDATLKAVQEKPAFLEEYKNRTGSLQGVEKAWGQYIVHTASQKNPAADAHALGQEDLKSIRGSIPALSGASDEKIRELISTGKLRQQ